MKKMKVTRLEELQNYLNMKKHASYKELSEVINISEATIRRDTDNLIKKGYLKKILGGVEVITNNEDINYRIRKQLNQSVKKKVASNASKYIKENTFIFLDSGTTVEHLIPYFKDKNITVVTNGVTHIEKLLQNGITTIILGGRVKNITKAIVGAKTMFDIYTYNFDACFMGANAFDNQGFYTPDIDEAQIKESVMNRSKNKYVLADTTKKNQKSNIRFFKLKNVVLITEEK